MALNKSDLPISFTHMSGKNSLGRFAVRRKTIRKRIRAKLGLIKPELRKRMHGPLSQTGRWLKSIVQGHFNYYGVPGNTASLSLFRHRLLVLWWHSVRRRSQKHRISWTRMLDLATRWLPAHKCSILIPTHVSPLLIRDKNRMR